MEPPRRQETIEAIMILCSVGQLLHTIAYDQKVMLVLMAVTNHLLTSLGTEVLSGYGLSHLAYGMTLIAEGEASLFAHGTPYPVKSHVEWIIGPEPEYTEEVVQ